MTAAGADEAGALPRRRTPLAGRRVTVLGLGTFGGGEAVARFLVAEGARVTVSDAKSPEQLAGPVAALAGLPIAWSLGGHREADVLEADLVVKNPAIPPDAPWVVRAREAGVSLTSELVLALERLERPFAVVTGSKGKTTTATLLGAMAGAVVAGNNERPLLAALPALPPGAPVVLEVSSFMAEDVARARREGATLPRPRAVVLTHLEPEHLNWHGTLEAYYEAKLSLLDLGPEQVLVPAGHAELVALAGARRGGAHLLRAALDAAPEAAPAGPPPDVRVEGGVAVLDHGAGGPPEALFPLDALRLLGRHNRVNALLAAAAARALGAAPAAIAAAAAAFAPLPHRLEPVGRRADGVAFVDDSTATTPSAAIAAVEALGGLGGLGGPLVVLLGGSDKGHDPAELAAVVARRCHGAVCLGATGPRIAAALEAAAAALEAAGAGPAARVARATSFEDAFAQALALCPPGGTVLLAPATASYDMFANFKARGERFRALAAAACAASPT